MSNKISHITNAEIVSDYLMKITFDDGESKTVDFKKFIKDGVSSELKDINYFKQFKVENGYITWENGFDFCPVYLKEYV